MTTPKMDEIRMKELFKQAMLELLKENKDLLADLFADVFEDVALVNAIKEGEKTDSVDRKEIFQILESTS